MKRTLTTLACVAAVALVGACSSTQPVTAITPDQLKQGINNVATVLAAGCTIVQPTLSATAVATANGPATVASSVNGVFCASQSALATATAASATPAASAPTAASAPAQ